MPMIVTKRHAENYADNRNSYNEGLPRHDVIYEVVKRDSGYSVQSHSWDCDTQRRVYGGFVDVPAKYETTAYP